MRTTKKVFTLFLFVNCINGQSLPEIEEERIKVCAYCTCSEIKNDDGRVVQNIQCSELDRIENLPDLDKIEWPENAGGLRVVAAFEGLGLTTLGKLTPNTQVETLQFTNNAIKTYWPDPFSDIPNLKQLSFSQNDLSQITPDLFTNIPNLEDLDLSYNKLTEFNPLDFKHLKKVKRLNLQSNLLKNIPVEALEPMGALEDLDLSKNGVFDVLLQRSSEALKGVKSLNLNGNRIRSVLKDSFPESNSLEILDLSNNIIEIVEEESFMRCTNLKELNLGQNNITFIFALPSSLQIVILKQNTLRRWPEFPSDITYIDLSYNRLTEMYDESIARFDHLEVLNLAGNQIKHINIEKNLTKLFSLDLSYNQLTEIPKSLSAQNFPNLEELRLDGNPIQSIYFKNILSVRSLFMNELSLLAQVDEKAFSNVVGKSLDEKNCFSLYLSNCRFLSEIQEGAFDGTSVCSVDISNNNLTHLSQDLLPWKSLEVVNLQHNPWDCGCHLQWVMKDLLPNMYRSQSQLLAQLRCGSPRAVQGLRLVHWYNWTDAVFCGDMYMKSGTHGTYMLAPTTEREDNFFTKNLTPILGVTIIVGLLVAIALSVYLVKGRRRHKIRQAALKRKRQSAIDARNSNGQQKEPFSVLNKV